MNVPMDAFVIEEPAGVLRRGEMVRFGVPFAQGWWLHDTAMGWACCDVRGHGHLVAATWHIVQRWPDGSVRLAFCHAAVDIDAQSVIAFTPDPQAILPEVTDVLLNAPCSAVELVLADRHGEDRTGLKISASSAGFGQLPRQTLLNDQFEVTGETRAMGNGGLLVTTIVGNTRSQAIPMGRLQFRIDAHSLLGDCSAQLAMGYSGHPRSVRYTAHDHPLLTQSGLQAVLTAQGHEDLQIAYPLGGECRLNRVWFQACTAETGFVIAVRNMGENFPFRAFFEDLQIVLELWPDGAGGTWFGGMSKQFEIGILPVPGGFEGGSLAAVQPVYFPLAVQIPPQRLAIPGCFTDIPTLQPGRFGRFESWLRWVMANRGRAYGLLHFGDETNGRYQERQPDPEVPFYLNNEYDFPFLSLGQFCRTNDRMSYEDGRAAVLHMMNIDSITVSEDPICLGGQYPHGNLHGIAGGRAAADHEWLEGLLLWHVYDRRPPCAAAGTGSGRSPRAPDRCRAVRPSGSDRPSVRMAADSPVCVLWLFEGTAVPCCGRTDRCRHAACRTGYARTAKSVLGHAVSLTGHLYAGHRRGGPVPLSTVSPAMLTLRR